jgi:hypothetical protein
MAAAAIGSEPAIALDYGGRGRKVSAATGLDGNSKLGIDCGVLAVCGRNGMNRKRIEVDEAGSISIAAVITAIIYSSSTTGWFLVWASETYIQPRHRTVQNPPRVHISHEAGILVAGDALSMNHVICFYFELPFGTRIGIAEQKCFPIYLQSCADGYPLSYGPLSQARFFFSSFYRLFYILLVFFLDFSFQYAVNIL